MSRCFPFPPPGYERKTITDDSDFLKKEKHREKKYKKEKKDKDKDKKEGKEKREKERSDEKHKEKKDKKEKHKDKKKDKEKHRDKDKHRTDNFLPDEKRVVGLPGAQIPMLSEKSQDRANVRSAALVEKRVAGQPALHNGEWVGKNNHLAPGAKSSKYATELGWRSAVEEKRTINQMADKHVGTERKKDGMVKLQGKSPGPVVDRKERSKERASLDGSHGRTDERGIIAEARSSGSTRVPNSVGMGQNRVGGAARAMEKRIDQRMEGKEKNREKEGNDGKGDKRKENDREKPIHKEIDREKEKRKEEKVKVTSKQKHVEQSRTEHGSKNNMLKSSVKDGSKKDFSGIQNSGLRNIPRNSNHSSGAVNNLGKRKDIGLNGIYDEHTTGPNKLARTTTSTHPSMMENGRSLEPCQSSAALASATQRPPLTVKVDPTRASDDTHRVPPMNMKVKVDVKEQKINGMIPHPSSQSTAKPDRKPDALPATARPPHPDTKCLSQVLSVPKLDEWSDFDDQEWLFSSSYGSQTRKKPEVESSGVDNTPQTQKGKLLACLTCPQLVAAEPHARVLTAIWACLA